MVESSSAIIDDQYPLSAMQQGMLFHRLHSEEPGVDVEQVVCTLAERVSVPELLIAWDLVIARYDVLRTCFDWESRAQPTQTVCRSVELPTRLLDWRRLAPAAQRDQLVQFLADDRSAAFDLREAPLMRLTIIRCGDAEYEMVWTFHHAILDGRSFPILLKEVFGVYEATVVGREPRLSAPRQYRTFIDWLHSQNPEASRAFWRSRLGGFTAPTPLLAALPRSAAHGRGQCEVRLSALENARLRTFARTAQCSVSTLVNGAWSLLLSRYTGTDDVLFGTTMACRQSAAEGADDVVGLFINTLPFRTPVAPDAVVFDWLLGLRNEQIALREHEHTPLVLVQSWSDVPPGTPLFETLVVFENYLLDSALRRQGGPWEHRRFAYHGQTNYPLALVCYADTEMLLHLEYDRARLDDAIADQMLAHMARLLQALAEDGRRRLGDVLMLSAEERAALMPIPAETSGIPTFCVQERFEQRAAETPDAPALTCGDLTLTYGELNRRANQLAHRLQSMGVQPDSLVGVHLERSEDLVIALLAVLKAGGAYLPLDPEYPKDRIRFMLDDAKVPVVVSAKALVERLPPCHAQLVVMGDTTGESQENPTSLASVDNLAYVIYTSGSTGNPKGVLITHANMSRLFSASDGWFQFGRQDVWTLFHSYAFDFSVWEIWGALLYGGRLVVVPYWVSRDPDAFIDLLVREHVTVLNQTPSAFRQLVAADAARAHRPALDVRYVVLGGEALDVVSLRPWFDRRGDERPRIINMFGITETTVHVTYRPITRADVERGAGSVIGVPIPDLAVCVLDPHRQLVPVGVTGELYVGGAGVARGYLNRAELTHACFVDDPIGHSALRLYKSGDLGRWLPSGELEYRGRIDDQVKIRGFRIEPGEVETILRRAPGVRDVTVVAQPIVGMDPRLVAYVVLDPAGTIDILRGAAQAELPDYMIPAFVQIDAIPMTSNGKVDRQSLPAPSAQPRVRRYIAPHNETERTLAEVWTSVLRQDRISTDDNFFELGGDSIIGIQVIARCRQAGLHLTTRDIFKHPTIAGLSALVTPVAAPTIVEAFSVGDAPLTPIASWFFEQNLAEPNHWNQAFMLEVRSDLNLDWLQDALEFVVARHDTFRLRFRRTERGWQPWYVPLPSSVHVERVDLSSAAAEPAAAAIEAAAANAQSSLDITNGPLLRVVSFRGSAEGPRLLIAMHHAIVDAVSWRVFLEDLEGAYVAIRANRQPRLEHRTTSFKGWAERLVTYAAVEARSGFEAWARPHDSDAVALPCDRTADPALNTEASAHAVTVSLGPADTDRLLRHAPSAYSTQVNDLLLAALAQAVLSWTDCDSIVVDLEGHGREDAFDSVDVSRTVGWFTTLFPVRLSQPDASPGGLITHTKETLRQLHDRGLSYGALRYLSPDAGVRRTLAELPERQLLFNYLGQTDAITAGSSLFHLTAEPTGPSRAAANRRSHLIDVLASITDGQLRVQWTYSDRFHDAVTIANVAARYLAALRGLIEHCVEAPTATLTLSDLPLADLVQSELDELTRRFPAFEDVYPLAPMQQLFHSIEALKAAPGFEQWEFVLEGPLDIARLRWAWERVVSRHPILRTAFAQLGSARPYQIVLPRADLSWHSEDWRAYAPDDRESRLQQFLAADRNRPFNLEEPPLMRVAVFRTGDEGHRLVWSTHHLLIDGWSWPLIFSELSTLYSDGRASALQQPCGYRDYIAWLHQHDDAPDERYWRRMLAGMSDPTPVPCLPETAEHIDAGADARYALSAEATEALGAMARAHRVTLGTIVSAAWSLVLAHHSGESDIMFGASVAGRPDDVLGIEGMVGPCVNNIPIRVLVDPATPVRRWLQQLHVHIGDLTAHQATPLMSIHACSDVPAWRRLFNSLLVVQNYIVDEKAVALGGARLRLQRCPEATTYPATVVVTPGERIEIKVLRSGERFTTASATVVCRDLVNLLESMPGLGDSRVEKLLSRLPSDTRGTPGQASAVRPAGGAGLTAPRTEMERALAAIWRDLFNGDVGTDENYFELGIHSLTLVRAHERIAATLKSGLSIVALFQYPTIRDLAAHLTASADPARRETDIPARARQQRLASARRKHAAKTTRLP